MLWNHVSIVVIRPSPVFTPRDQSSENLIFYLKAEKYKACSAKEERQAEAQRVYEAHLMPNAQQPVNVDQTMRQAIYEHIAADTVGADLFVEGTRRISFFHHFRFVSFSFCVVFPSVVIAFSLYSAAVYLEVDIQRMSTLRCDALFRIILTL
jgi:hypothetical protein